MVGTVRLHDYRCFRREQPAALPVELGFTAFLGPNNAGKSALIRSLYELKDVFTQFDRIRESSPTFIGTTYALPVRPPMFEAAEILNDRRDPTCSIDFVPHIPTSTSGNAVVRTTITFNADATSYQFRLFGTGDVDVGLPNIGAGVLRSFDIATESVETEAGGSFALGPLLNMMAVLSRVQFVGPFRNAINEGAGSYFDSQIGTGFIANWHSWKSGASKQQNRAIERVTDDVRSLIGAKSLEITASVELKTLQVILDRRPALQASGAWLGYRATHCCLGKCADPQAKLHRH